MGRENLPQGQKVRKEVQQGKSEYQNVLEHHQKDQIHTHTEKSFLDLRIELARKETKLQGLLMIMRLQQ